MDIQLSAVWDQLYRWGYIFQHDGPWIWRIKLNDNTWVGQESQRRLGFGLYGDSTNDKFDSSFAERYRGIRASRPTLATMEFREFWGHLT